MARLVDCCARRLVGVRVCPRRRTRLAARLAPSQRINQERRRTPSREPFAYEVFLLEGATSSSCARSSYPASRSSAPGPASPARSSADTRSASNRSCRSSPRPRRRTQARNPSASCTERDPRRTRSPRRLRQAHPWGGPSRSRSPRRSTRRRVSSCRTHRSSAGSSRYRGSQCPHKKRWTPSSSQRHRRGRA